MVDTLSLDQMRQKTAIAQKLIENLQKHIEKIKLQTTPEFQKETIKVLQKENEQLRAEVENLKKKLEDAENNKPHQVHILSKFKALKSEYKQNTVKRLETKAEQEVKKINAHVDQKVDISKLDIKVGKIVEVSKHPDADSLYVEKINLGERKFRNVCSGLVKYIPLEELQDKMVVVLCNLKPSKLRGVLSEAMVLCASTPEKVELLLPPSGAQIGDRITVEGFFGEPVPEINTKNNIFGLVQVDLKTDENLNATYQGKFLEVVGKGPVTAPSLSNVSIK